MKDSEKRMRREIAAIVTDHGIPTDVDSANRLATRLHPVVQKYRGDYYRHDVTQMGADMNVLGLEVAPAKMRDYPPHATHDAVIRAIGMGEKPSNIELELVDDVTRALITQSVPAFAFPDHPGAMDKVIARVSSALLRHARKAGRDAVADTAKLGRVRDAALKRPVGARIGYARVMSGRENCAFCAMLASRGPVYSEDTATRRRDGNRYHDGCDCRAVLVLEGQKWPGQEEYLRLEQRWRKATGDLSGADMWEAWRLDHDSGIPGVVLRAPRRDRALMRTAPYFRDEPLPRSNQLVKHSIWGWRPKHGPVTAETARNGHSFDSIREKGTFVPKRWTDQDIADAITATMEDPYLVESGPVRRIAYREIDDVMVAVEWDYNQGRAKINTAYPVYGAGVQKYEKATGNRIDWETDAEKQMKKARRPSLDEY